MMELVKCWCGRHHFGGEHRVYTTTVSWYRRYGKCKECGRYVGNLVTDELDDPALEMGYHTHCYKEINKEKV